MISPKNITRKDGKYYIPLLIFFSFLSLSSVLYIVIIIRDYTCEKK